MTVAREVIDRPSDAVARPPGWWRVTDEDGNATFYQFREDGRARLLRGSYWDWCRVQGEWEPAGSEDFVEWAGLDGEPEAVFGEPGWREQSAEHRRRWRQRLREIDGAWERET